MRKKLLICMIAVLSMIMAAGCGNNTPQQTQNTEPAPQQIQQEEKTAAPDGTVLIDEDTAKNMVLEKVEGAALTDFTEFEMDRDMGIWKYEGELYYNGMEYEFEINAETGEMIKWQEDKEYM